MRVTIHAQADREARKAMRWYEKQRAGLGRTLRARLDEALDRIAFDPEVGAKYRGPFHFMRVKQFPYAIYYCKLADHIWVVAIAHERRRPNYWRRRKPS